jgi:hypothetical protein
LDDDVMTSHLALPFGGSTFSPQLDSERLSTALGKVYALMRDGRWRTLNEIAVAVRCSEAGASARLRDLRKPKFRDVYPNQQVDSDRVEGGLWKYRVVI